MQIEHVDKENDTVILKLTIAEAKALACIMGAYPSVPATARQLRERCQGWDDTSGYSKEALDTKVLDNYNLFCNADKIFGRDGDES